jgi:ATP-dependent DNA helicase RecG
LVAHLSIRKRNQFTEREVFPYATLDDLRLDLIPVVKKMAAGRVTGHPWKDMTEMELLKSAGLYETDKRTGKTGFNRAAILLLGREEVIQQVAPGYVTDCLLRINLVHREFSGTFPARIIIEKDRLVAENWNRALRHGRIDPESFEPYPKNPTLARFFVNIGYADTLGSGVRNLMKYTKLYSGGEPELIEGEIFRTIIPLGLNTPASLADKLPIKVADKLPIKVADKLTASEMEFIKLLGQFLDEYEWITNAKAREITGKSEGSVKRFLRNLAGKDVLEIQGENKNRQYRLRK